MSDEINIGKALDYIRITAPVIAKAKADRIYLSEFRKSKKALLFMNAPEGTIQSKESYAYAHAEYQLLLDNLKIAVEEEEKLHWMMIAAQAKIEIYRTQSANARFIDKAHT